MEDASGLRRWLIDRYAGFRNATDTDKLEESAFSYAGPHRWRVLLFAVRLRAGIEGWHRAVVRLSSPASSGSISSGDVSKLVNLVLLAALLVPFFVVYYCVINHAGIGACLGIAGLAMVSSLAVLRTTGNMWLSRDLFLAAFSGFLFYATWQLGSLVSPTAFWFAAIPVVAVLLGGARAGLLWLAAVLVAICCLYLSTQGADSPRPPFAWPVHLYWASLSAMVIAIFLFVLMVDAARRKTFAQLEEANTSIRELAQRDALTGLYNRRYLWEALQNEEDLARAGGCGFWILLVDVDHFKRINDVFGHVVGDIVLKAVADTLSAATPDELCGRYGGEEFLLLLRTATRQRAMAVAERVRRDVSQLRFEHVQCTGQVTVSVGVAQFMPTETFAETFKAADAALYQAKIVGRNRIELSARTWPLARVAV